MYEEGDEEEGGMEGGKWNPRRVHPLTEGPWVVDDGCVWVDTSRELVIFVASKDTPLQKHLYCGSCAAGADPTCIVRCARACVCVHVCALAWLGVCASFSLSQHTHGLTPTH